MSADRSTSRRGNDSRQQQPRSYDRSRATTPSRTWNDSNSNRSSARSDSRSYNRNDSRSNNRNDSRSYNRNDSRSSSRGDSRSYSRNDSRGNSNWRGDRSRPSFGNRQHYFTRGRVERILPYGGGFRIWIGGAPYPFFVPSAYYYRNHFRIGLTIGLGGYYNPLGYYDYYDGYDGGYYGNNRAYSDGVLRGTVESVDYRSNTFVIRNEASGSFVTISMRQRLTEVRPGDYVELQGEWTRNGLFQAYTADLLNGGNQYRQDDQYRPDDQYPR